MRILAIRGCNLASLAGEFEIDLANGPIGAAGVFAIVGNTGAGKSTLLDALCVALFDRTPRLTNHSRVQVGRGASDPLALGAQDVRTLLRRGAAQGYAEVDFEAGDARRYRARWSVRRARGQADGVLQAQQMHLTALDRNERIGGTKTETLEAIHARLGLTFDQFRRSALLAQGEFAAFLRADGKDRSELLERMTGTEIYSRLSVQAHLRATLAAHQLSERRTAALAITVFDETARITAEAELVLAEQAKLVARRRSQTAREAARWLAEAATRAEAVRAARLALAETQAAIERAEPERAELALRRRAEALRGPWEHAQRVAKQLTLARTEAANCARGVLRATDTRVAITEHHEQLRELLEPIRSARIAAGLVERSHDPLARVSELALVAGRAAATDAAWLGARAALGAELAGWSDLDAKFGSRAVAADAISGHARTLAQQAEVRAKLVRTRVVAAEEARTQTERHADAQRKADAFRKRRGLTLEAARKAEDEARRRKTEIEGLCGTAAAARQARASCEELDRQLAELAAASTHDAASRITYDTAKVTASILRTERERVVAELRKSAGYEHARAELVDGEPCPLCGAEAHPWHDRGALDEVIVGASALLAESTAQVDAATRALATLDARAHHRQLDHVRLTKQGAVARASAEAAVPTWADQLTSLGELSLVRDPACADADQLGAELHAAASKGLELARTVRSQTEAATKAAADAQVEIVMCQTALDQSTTRVAELDRKIGDIDTTVGRIEGERAGRVERHMELTRELALAIARWRIAVPAEAPPAAALTPSAPAPGMKRIPMSIEEAARAGKSVALDAKLDAELTAHRAWMTELAIAWRTRAEAVAHAEAVLAAALALADTQTREADRAVADQLARCGSADRQQDDLAAACAITLSELDAARESSHLADDELHRLLASSPTQLDRLVDQLARLERAVETANAVVAERERLVGEHASARPANLGSLADEPPPAGVIGESSAGDAVDARISPLVLGPNELADLAARADAADKHAAELTAALAADRNARSRRDAALAKLADAEGAASVDRILGDVIGSHDGKLFRSFAQSLTLDGLLAVANAHLEELAPRYQLERVPRHDLELQVIDRDLGNEVRSVQSLSGGEAFLVSLALALGLSSMSAHDVRVRTLLIDEGFGTLDPATLEMALSVLEALRQQGRQVGVISHVPQLVERVGAHVRVIARGGGRSEVVVS